LGLLNFENRVSHEANFCFEIEELVSLLTNDRKYGTSSRLCFSARDEVSPSVESSWYS
jgi:hypothetical protein